MTTVPVCVGMDYHKATIRVCVVDAQGAVLANRNCPNDPQQVIRFVERFGPVRGSAIECCEGAADFAESLSAQSGWSVHLAHPGYVQRMRQNPDKTDHSDARLLADLERVGYLPRVWLAPQGIRELRRLVRYRQQLVDERRNTKLRIRSLLRAHRCFSAFSVWTKPWFTWIKQVVVPEQSRWILDQHLAQLARLDKAVNQVEDRLMRVTRDDNVVQELLALNGVGRVTAWVLRAEIGWFHRFRSGKQLARFCGLTPRNASSGFRQADAGLIKAGRGALRSVLIEAAHRLKRYDPRWSALAAGLRAAGKPGSVIAAAIANRWVRWLFYELTQGQAAA